MAIFGHLPFNVKFPYIGHAYLKKYPMRKKVADILVIRRLLIQVVVYLFT